MKMKVRHSLIDSQDMLERKNKDDRRDRAGVGNENRRSHADCRGREIGECAACTRADRRAMGTSKSLACHVIHLSISSVGVNLFLQLLLLVSSPNCRGYDSPGFRLFLCGAGVSVLVITGQFQCYLAFWTLRYMGMDK
jgi:hypothetical protein